MADMSIALGARPVQIEGPINHLANAMKLREAQNQNALHELSLQEARAVATERNALRGLNPADADYQDQLMRVSPTQGIAYMKEKHLAGAAADTAAKAKSELVDARLKRSREYLSNVTTPEEYMAWHQANHADPILGPELKARGVTAESAKANIERALAAPGGLQQLIDQSKLGVEKYMEMNKPTFQNFMVPGVGVQTGTVRQGAFAPDKLYGSSDVISPEAEAQKARIAAAGRAPVQPRPEQPPVAVVDPDTGKQVLVSREEAITKRMSPAAAMESLAPKEIQRREATYPQATASVQGLESKSEKFIKDLELLRNHKGLDSITGIAAGRLPGITAAGRAAQALYDKVVAKGGFQALQDMREASKTGGALGNVSNQEGKQLVSSFSAIDRKQEAKDVRAAIDQAIEDIRGAKSRIREAYDSTYQYKSAKPEAATSPSGLTPAEQAELAALKARFNK